MPERRSLEVVELLVGRIADHVRLRVLLGGQKNGFRQTREGDLRVTRFRREQPHVERAGEAGNPGQTLDDADVGSGHQDGLIDILRLGVVEHDGVRPDKPQLGPLLPQDFLLEATDWKRHPEAFAPRKATPYYGYGYQVWTFPGAKRRFALLGVYGQAIYVDPEQKLVMVHMAANATARAGQTSMGREMGALWHAIITHRGRW